MRVLVVDDERLARERLVRMLADIEGFEAVGEAANGRQAIERTHQLHPDIVLMDVSMPDMDGLEATRHLSTLNAPPVVIFTTAYSGHALEAFDAQALGYLLKPVRVEKLLGTLQNATRGRRVPLPGSAQRTHLCTSYGSQVSLIPIDEVYFFRAEHKYVTLVHKHGEALLEEPLKSLAEEFSARFVRIHRNALVSLAHIQGIEKNRNGTAQVVLNGCPIRLDVSRRHLVTLRRIIKVELTHQ